MSFGDVKKYAATLPMGVRDAYEKALVRIKQNREDAKMLSRSDLRKSDAFVADGFGSITQYYDSGMVEFLTFEGDYYDNVTDTLYQNYKIVVVDRAYVVESKRLITGSVVPPLYMLAGGNVQTISWQWGLLIT